MTVDIKEYVPHYVTAWKIICLVVIEVLFSENDVDLVITVQGDL